MANLSEKRRSFLAAQKNLLDLIEEKEMTLNLDIAVTVRRTVYEAIKNSGLSRESIVSHMSEYLGRNISVDMLNAWTAQSKGGRRFPLEYLPAFCHATKNYDLVALAANSLRIEIILPDEVEEARLLMAKVRLQRLQDEVKRMEREIDKKRKIK